MKAPVGALIRNEVPSSVGDFLTVERLRGERGRRIHFAIIAHEERHDGGRKEEKKYS